MMIGKKNNLDKGMTLLEVVIAIAILGIFVVPIAAYFNSAALMRVDTQSISAATINAENMIKDLGEQIAKDVSVQRANESLGESNLVKSYVGEKASEMSEGEKIQQIGDFFNITGASLDSFNRVYNTDKYSYEIAIWKMDSDFKSLISAGEIDWNDTFLDSAMKVYSDAAYDFSATELAFDSESTRGVRTQIELPSTLMDNEFLGKDVYFKDKYDAKIVLKQTGEIESSEGIVCDQSYAGLYDVKLPDTGHTGKSGSGRTILIDASKVNNDTPQHAATFKLNNPTGAGRLTVQIRKNKELEDAIIDGKVGIITDTANDIIIDRPTDIEVESNYLIALVIRDKQPATGRDGKVVKTMVEVFSYEHPTK